MELGLALPFPFEARAGQAHGVAAELMVQGIDGLHEAVLVRVDLAAHARQGRLHDIGRREALEHHPGPLVKIPVATDARQGPRRRGADGPGVVGRRLERLDFVAAILLLVDAVLVGADEHHDGRGDEPVLAQFLRGAGRMRGDGFGELEGVRDRTTEGTRHQHALPRAGVFDDIMAGDATQLEREAFADHAGDAPDEPGVGLGEIDRGQDTVGAQAGREAGADAPDVFRFDASQEGGATFDGSRHDDHAAARLVGLGALIGQLAEDLRRGHPQRDRDAGPLQDIGPDAQPQGLGIIIRHVGETQEGFVDRIDLEVTRLLSEGGHHALGEIAVDGEVGREDADAVRFAGPTHLEIGRAHRDAQRLGFGRTRDHAAVVVREHHDRHADERRIEGALARGVEVVAVGEGAEHGVSSGARRRPPSPRYGIRA